MYKYKQTPINCPHCHEYSGYNVKDLMILTFLNDVLCKVCGKTIAFCNKNIVKEKSNSVYFVL